MLFATDDPTGQLQAAWAAKECLRQLLDALPATDGPLVTDPRRDPGVHGPALRPYEIRARLRRFYDLAAVADIPELTRLAGTVETWWPTIEAYLRLRVTNARTEGYNRKIKQIKRVAVGFAIRLPTNAVSCSTTPRPRRNDHRAEPTVTLHREEPVRQPARAVPGVIGVPVREGLRGTRRRTATRHLLPRAGSARQAAHP